MADPPEARFFRKRTEEIKMAENRRGLRGFYKWKKINYITGITLKYYTDI